MCKVFVDSGKLKTPSGQLEVKIVTKNIAEATGVDIDAIRNSLGTFSPRFYVKYCVVQLSTPEEAKALVTKLKDWWNLRPQEVPSAP